MKTNAIILLLIAGLALLLVGCGPTGQPDASPQQQPVEADGDPLDITALSFSHSASYTEGCYLIEIKGTDSGTHIRAEELFGLQRVAEAVTEEDVLAQLGELTGKYHVERWDGFNASDSMVQDGSSFSLDITLADGSTITARGSNSFPKHYSKIEDVLWALYDDWMERYAMSEEEWAAQEGADEG